MASEMDWAYTTCLSCDNQIFEGEFCSQACRLADLEKGSLSEPASPTNTSWSTKGFYLPPAYDFSVYRSTSCSSTPSSPRQTSYFTTVSQVPTPSSSPSSTSRLTPSSSRSSLSSMSGLQASSSSTFQQGISPQAASYLRSYLSSFDQVRDMKRRATNP